MNVSNIRSSLSERSPYRADDVIRCVCKLGSDQWADIGFELGFKLSDFNSMTMTMPLPASKLRVILEMKASAVGQDKVVDEILAACERIPNPIIGAVRDELDKRNNNLKVKNVQ